ncbi:hypothetical protein E3N88_42745 [Mikania micrantha]|uniref:Uncharacterized protein n=1 Tax=Mikania micrantha TaxID=192012 RepID=A0A5N6LGU4_9ASTR|nr:hypothetical protein E3N88_42745 [Mikania micrantha]
MYDLLKVSKEDQVKRRPIKMHEVRIDVKYGFILVPLGSVDVWKFPSIYRGEWVYLSLAQPSLLSLAKVGNAMFTCAKVDRQSWLGKQCQGMWGWNFGKHEDDWDGEPQEIEATTPHLSSFCQVTSIASPSF